VWIDVQLARSNLHYWRNEPEAGLAVLELVRPLVELRAKPRLRIDFFTQVSSQRSRASRYVVDDSILDDCRAAWAAVVDAGLENEMFWVGFQLGFCLLWYRDYAGAQAELERALDIAWRADDKTLALRCLVYLCLAHLCQHNAGTVKELAPRAEDLARSLAFPEYVGMAKAMKAWVAWKEGRPADVEVLAEEALAQWRLCVVHYSWYWAGLWPLIAVRLDAGRVEEAVGAARELLGPDQQRLAEGLEPEVQAALDAWQRGDARVAGEILGRALELASRLGYA
jgi:tetratricopeptide (TPR) repeat protein